MADRAGTLLTKRSGALTGFHWNHADLDRGLVHGPGANSIHHQFLLEHQARQESERQSVGSDHARMDRAVTAAAWKFRRHASGLSRPLRIQPARARTRFHHAKRTGRPERTCAAQASRSSFTPNESEKWKFLTQLPLVPIPAFGTPRSASGFFSLRKSCSSADFFPLTFSSGSMPQPGYWPHGLLNVPVGTI